MVTASATVQSAAPVTAPEQPPTDYAGVAKLLERARGEPEAAKRATYELVRRALAALTGAAGEPRVLAEVKAPRGDREQVLLPERERVQVAAWGSTGLRVVGRSAVRVGERAVALDDRAITVWSAGPKRLLADDVLRLEAVQGEPRFLLARGGVRSFLVDTDTGESLLEGPSRAALFAPSGRGTTRLTHYAPATGFRLLELPKAEAVQTFAAMIAADPARGLVLTSRVNLLASLKKELSIALVRVADGAVETQLSLPADKWESRVFAMGTLSPDGKSLFSLDVDARATRISLISGKEEVLAKSPAGQPFQRGVFTADSAHVCLDPPGLAYPKAKLVPGTTQRCYEHGDVAHIAHLAAPPAGFRRAAREELVREGFGHHLSYETISKDGNLVAAVLYDGKPTPTTVQRITIAVYDAKTGRQLWNQFLPGTRTLSEQIDLVFTDDNEHLWVDGVRVAARTGEQVDGIPQPLGAFAAPLTRFGVALDPITLQLARLGFAIPAFPSSAMVLEGEAKPLALSIFVDPVSGTVALRSKRSKKTVLLVPAQNGALALLPDGKLSVRGNGDDLVCRFGQLLAPIGACLGQAEVPASQLKRVVAELGSP